MPSPTLLTSLALACTGALAAAQGTTTRVSVNSAGFPWNSDGNFPDVSSNGKWIVFDSGSSNLVATDVNATWDVFLHDRSTGTTELVSTGSSGALGDAASYSPRISADGRFVVFTSTATNLVVGDANGEIDVFLRDRQLATTSIVSLGSDGAQGNDFSAKADLSDDGAFVVFVSRATNLVAGDTNGLDDVFVRDLAGGTTTLASVTASGVQGDHDSDEPRISGDGRFVAFTSRSTTFAPLDVATDDDVFLFDRLDPGLTLVSVAFGGGLANDRSSSPFISADGRYVVFDSLATNLVASDSNGQFDVFVRDLTLGTTAIASLNHVGAQVNATSRRASISDDGRRVAFSSSGSNVVAGVEPTPFEPDIFVRDLPAGTTERWSVASTGTAANDASDWATINGDGSTVVFTSVASNLIEATSTRATTCSRATRATTLP